MAPTDKNPFSPGAGHSPPYLAGREQEIAQFQQHLTQSVILKNVILTGLRGTGKTVLMEDRYKPLAQRIGWAWVGSDFAESCFLSEQNLCTRMFTDLSLFTSDLTVPGRSFGFAAGAAKGQELSFDFLTHYFESQPGLIVDKLKATLEFVWMVVQRRSKIKGIVFAYDEAQLVRDREEKDEYPLAMLLESFQSLQRKAARYFLLLTGLPTLFPRLVGSRTYAERMFTVQEIGRLPVEASRDAIIVPTRKSKSKLSDSSVQSIIEVSDGYPYFIQFVCKEAFDYLRLNPDKADIPLGTIIRKLDSDFFAGRWENLTDRQRDLLYCIAHLDRAANEFTISEIVEVSKSVDIKRFGPGDVSQMLPRLVDKGLIYKNRLGKYCFAVPLFSRFIRRKFARTAEEYQQALY